MKRMNKKILAALLASATITILGGCSADVPVAGFDESVQGQENRQATQATDGTQERQPADRPMDGISHEQAESIALKDAGLTRADVMFIQAKEDWEDGRAIFDVEFYSGNQEYDYEIDKATGDILSHDYDIEGGTMPQGGGKAISIETAKADMLARVSGAGEQNIRIWEDWDDGRVMYEGEIYYNNAEYEFEIDASTGQLVEWSMEKYGR